METFDLTLGADSRVQQQSILLWEISLNFPTLHTLSDERRETIALWSFTYTFFFLPTYF